MAASSALATTAIALLAHAGVLRALTEARILTYGPSLDLYHVCPCRKDDATPDKIPLDLTTLADVLPRLDKDDLPLLDGVAEDPAPAEAPKARPKARRPARRASRPVPVRSPIPVSSPAMVRLQRP